MKSTDDITQSATPGPRDLVIIGAGLSGAYTVIRLCERLLDTEQQPSQPLRVTVVEKHGDFFGGVPYGAKSGASSLIITPLKEFLPEPELGIFQAWLRDHAEEVLTDFARYQGPRSAEWLERVGSAVRAGDCAEFHIPRYLWGRYLTDTVTRLANQATEAEVLDLQLVAADVTDLTSVPTGATPVLVETSAGSIEARAAVIAVGMPPTRKIFGDTQTSAVLIEEPYTPDLDTTMEEMAAAVARVDEPRIAIIGANAGSLEMLYMLANRTEPAMTSATIEVLSPQGRLPERYNEKADPAFQPTHLPTLLEHENVTADDILKAVKLDLADARGNGLGISDSLPPISSGVGALLPHLSKRELEAFVAHPGIEIGRLQRRAGDEYCDAADDLAQAGRMRVTAGSFTTVDDAGDGTATVNYTKADGTTATLDRCHVVVNCAGSGGLELPNQSALLQSILTSGLGQPTPSGHGLLVNDAFEAAPSIYVNGPLLAGNVVNGGGIWHVEHCGRIINFSTQLAALLEQRLVGS